MGVGAAMPLRCHVHSRGRDPDLAPHHHGARHGGPALGYGEGPWDRRSQLRQVGGLRLQAARGAAGIKRSIAPLSANETAKHVNGGCRDRTRSTSRSGAVVLSDSFPICWYAMILFVFAASGGLAWRLP